MKEIIYLDTEIMNSLLAQLDEGLVENFSIEQSNQLSEGEEIKTTREKDSWISGGLRLGTGALAGGEGIKTTREKDSLITSGWRLGTGAIPGGELDFSTKLGRIGNESEKYLKGILEGQKDILNKAFHDHALNVLLKKLEQKNLIQN